MSLLTKIGKGAACFGLAGLLTFSGCRSSEKEDPELTKQVKQMYNTATAMPGVKEELPFGGVKYSFKIDYQGKEISVYCLDKDGNFMYDYDGSTIIYNNGDVQVRTGMHLITRKDIIEQARKATEVIVNEILLRNESKEREQTVLESLKKISNIPAEKPTTQSQPSH